MNFPITLPRSAYLSRIVFVSGQWGAGEAGQAPGQLPVAASLLGSTLDSQILPTQTGSVVVQGAWAECQREFSTCPALLSALWSGAWAWGGAGLLRHLEESS